MKAIEEKLKDYGYSLPEGFEFVSVLVHDNLAYISGAMPFTDGETLPYTGKVGAEVTVEQAQEAARIAVMNALANLKKEVGSLDRVKQVVRITGYVASAKNFTDQAIVMNAATELLISIFGENGRHARTAIGTAVMPLDTPLEIEMIISLKDE